MTVCHEGLIRALTRLRAAIVAYADLISVMEPSPEREQVLDFTRDLSEQAKVLERLCSVRCGTARCVSDVANV